VPGRAGVGEGDHIGGGNAAMIWPPDPDPRTASPAPVGQRPDAEQLASLLELAERLATLTDLNAILDAVAEAAMRTLRPVACAIELLGADGAELAGSLTRGLDAACARWWADTGSTISAIIDQPMTLAPTWPEELRATAPPVVLRVPLAAPGKEPVGMLDLFAGRREALPAPELATLRSIAVLTSAAVEASRARLRDVLAVYTIAQSITGRFDLGQLAESVLRAIADRFASDNGAIILAESRQPVATPPQVIASLGQEPAPATVERLLARCAHRAAPFVLERLPAPALADPTLNGAGLVAPLWLDRKLLGLMLLTYTGPRQFRQSDLWLLSAIASQVTMALRNAQLYLWSEESAIAAERGRIARDIHDGLAQSLALKVIKLDICQKLIGRDDARLRTELEALKASVRTDIQDVRHSILALRPIDLEQRGLGEAVFAYAAEFSRDTGVTTRAHLDSLEAISPKTQTAIFRLVQEALNNIRKHAHATNAEISIIVEATGEILLTIADDGQGFDVESVLQRPPGQSGVGLRGMRERTLAAGGRLTIDSAPGRGARLTIHLPAR
jgi:signal transduction histidine kinase